MQKPNRDFPSKAHKGAYRKGREARQEGKTKRDCPYVNHRTHQNGPTYSVGFITWWNNGWDDMDEELSNGAKT